MRKQFLFIAIIIGMILLITCNDKKAPEPKSAVLISKHARPLRDVHFASSPERITRGEYLARGILRCFHCHSPRDTSLPGQPWIESKKGSGSIYFKFDTIWMVAPNITPDKETGAGNWTDDMFVRAIREGVGHDGRALEFMPFWNFANLSNEDLASVIVYVRSIPAIKNKLPQRHISQKFEAELQEEARDSVGFIAQPDFSSVLARGRYYIQVGECEGCHTGWYARNPGFFAGGNVIKYTKTDSVCSANLTPDISGVGGWTDAVFAEIMRTGKSGSLKWVMPWVAFRNVNDSDLSAILAALKTLPPVKHQIQNALPPTFCEVCGRHHGYGQYNRIEPIKGIAINSAGFASDTGAFVSKYGDTTKIRLKNKKLWIDTNHGQAELVAVTDSTFRASGFPATILFIKKDKGPVDSLYLLDIDPVVAKRVH